MIISKRLFGEDKFEFILSKEFIILIFCSIFTLANPLIYQIYLGQGPSEYLQMHFIVMISSGILSYFVIIVCHSLLVVLPKNKSLFSSALLFVVLWNVFLLTAIFLTQELFLEIYEINFPLARIYYSLTIISVSIMSINSIWNYYLIFRGKYSSVLKVNLFTLVMSFIGNTFCLWLFTSENRIIGYGFIKIGVAILTLFYFIYYVKPLVKINWASPFTYLKRAYRVLFGDVLTLLVILISPVLINLILVKYGYDNYISIFGVTKNILNFITIPSGMLVVYATPFLSQHSNDHFKLRQMIYEIKKLVWKFNIYPATMTLLFLVIFSRKFWGFDFFPTGVFLIIVGLSYLPMGLEVPYTVINRAFEKQIKLSKIVFFINVSSLGFLFILASINRLNLYFYSFILLFLAIIKFILIKFEAKKSLGFK